MAKIRDHVTTASALATGTEGPLRIALDRLRRYGLGERVIKSALAAGLAWWLATLVRDDPLPVLAPITAIFTIQLTLARSVLGSAQRVLGVSAGIAIAMLANRVIGLHWWAISLAVLISLIAGLRLFRLEPAGVEQMTVTAMLVMIVGASGDVLGVAGYHALDTLIGTAVGLAANSMIAPPSHVPAARLAVHAVGRGLIEVIDSLAAALASGLQQEQALIILERARAVAGDLDEVQAALDRAEESMRFNLPGRGQKPVLARYRRANSAMEHASVQTRVISRTIADCAHSGGATGIVPIWISPGKLGVPLANLFTASAIYLEYFLSIADDASAVSWDSLTATDALARLSDAKAAGVAVFDSLQPDGWILIGEVLSVTNQLLTDMTSTARDLLTSS